MKHFGKRGIELGLYRTTLVFLLLLDRQKTTDSTTRQSEKLGTNVDFSRIRCPLCKWQPEPAHRWFCASCTYPEYFDAGCGTCWNTFTTRGRCPGCNHQWRWTACLKCAEWSLHAAWYETDSGK